jgi:RND family efflux transporter MFP subunit
MKQFFLDKRFRILIGIILTIGLVVKISQNFGEKEVQEVVIEDVKKAEILVFGEWMPNSNREILGTVVRQDEVDILAEINGKIEKTFVRIGDSVQKNQILATYKKFDDLTQISYENAIRTFNTTKIATQNTIRSAEIALDTAMRELEQTKNTQNQNQIKVFDELKTRARNSETVFNNFLNWADRILGASSQYSYQVDATRKAIGKNNSLGRQKVKNETQELVREKENSEILPLDATEDEILRFAQMKIRQLELIKNIAWQLDDLIRNTTLSSSFSATDRTSFQSESGSFLNTIDSGLLTLSSANESAKSIGETARQAILIAENRIETAQASLEMTDSNGQSQISAVQSQLSLAASSLNDLEIRAPFSGKIFFENVTAGEQVKAGQKLFSITNEDSLLKVEAFLSADELSADRNIVGVKIELLNGTSLEPTEISVSAKLDIETQKFETTFYLPENEEIKKITSGSFAKIFIPTQNGAGNLLPISTFSFEPDGAEVLILNEENVLERRKIETGKIIADSVEVLSGLNAEEKIIRFRNRFYAGQKVIISN